MIECECWWDGEEIETVGCPLHETPADRRLACNRKLIVGLFANETGDFSSEEIADGRLEVAKLRAGLLC